MHLSKVGGRKGRAETKKNLFIVTSSGCKPLTLTFLFFKDYKQEIGLGRAGRVKNVRSHSKASVNTG